MSALFTNFITEYGLGNIDLINDNIVMAPLSNTYTFSAGDTYVSDISSHILTPAVEIGGTKYVSADDVFDTTEDQIDFNGITGSVNAFIMYKNTGVSTTSELISYHDEDFKGLTKTLTEGDLRLIKNTSGFFQVTPEDVFVGRVASFTYVRVAYPNQQEFRS